MTVKEKIAKLANDTGSPSITISLNTHRSLPDRLKDEIQLKNLLNETEKLVIEKFGKREAENILSKIGELRSEISMDENLESLHIFLSDNIKEIIRTTWPAHEDRVSIDDSFDLRALIKDYTRSEEYLILVLTQGGINLYEAINNGIEEEIVNEDFPFNEFSASFAKTENKSDSKYSDNKLRGFYLEVDKAVAKVAKERDLKCVILSTEDNYNFFMQVVSKPDIYIGHMTVNYNNSQISDIAESGWQVVEKVIFDRKADAIEEVRKAISDAKVLTDLKEIYRAAENGQAELLIVSEDYSQAVEFIDEATVELLDDDSDMGNDVINTLAWKVLSQKGRVLFVKKEQIAEFGNIVLKTRY